MSSPWAEYPDNVSTVLLIDDSKFLRRANELSLTKAGHQIVTASDGEEGLRLAREKKPDIIVLDMMLPKLGGAQLLQLLKGDPLTAKIPVIVLSSLPQKNELKLIADGAAAYLEKSSLALDQCSSELSRAITKILSSVPATESHYQDPQFGPRDCLVATTVGKPASTLPCESGHTISSNRLCQIVENLSLLFATAFDGIAGKPWWTRHL